MRRSAVRSPQAWREFDRTAAFIAGGLSVSLAALTLAGYSPFSPQPSPPAAVERLQPAAPEQPSPTPVAAGGENTPPVVDLREAVQGAGPPLIRSEPKLVERAPKIQAPEPVQPVAADPPPVETVSQEKAPVAPAAADNGPASSATQPIAVPPPPAATAWEVETRAAEPARQESAAVDVQVRPADDAVSATSAERPQPPVETTTVQMDVPDVAAIEEQQPNAEPPPAAVAGAEAPASAAEPPVTPPAPSPAIRKKPAPAAPGAKPVPKAGQATASQTPATQTPATQTSGGQQPASQPIGKKTAAVQPGAGAVPASVPPTAPQSSVAYRKNADAVIVYGRVKSQEERDAVLKAASETFSRKVVDHVVIDDKVAPLKHRAKLHQAAGLVQNVDGTARIQIDGDTVSISGRIESESQRQRYLEEAGKVFGPGVKVEDRLKPAAGH